MWECLIYCKQFSAFLEAKLQARPDTSWFQAFSNHQQPDYWNSTLWGGDITATTVQLCFDLSTALSGWSSVFCDKKRSSKTSLHFRGEVKGPSNIVIMCIISKHIVYGKLFGWKNVTCRGLLPLFDANCLPDVRWGYDHAQLQCVPGLTGVVVEEALTRGMAQAFFKDAWLLQKVAKGCKLVGVALYIFEQLLSILQTLSC